MYTHKFCKISIRQTPVRVWTQAMYYRCSVVRLKKPNWSEKNRNILCCPTLEKFRKTHVIKLFEIFMSFILRISVILFPSTAHDTFNRKWAKLCLLSEQQLNLSTSHNPSLKVCIPNILMEKFSFKWALKCRERPI